MVSGTSNSGVSQVTDKIKMCRNKRNGLILTKAELKKCKIVFDKRIIFGDYCTVPYGM